MSEKKSQPTPEWRRRPFRTGDVEAITRRMFDAALAGDKVAVRFCRDLMNEREVTVDLPPLRSAVDAIAAIAAIFGAVAAGEIVLGDAVKLARLVEVFIHAMEVAELEIRLRNQEGGQ